MKYTDGIPMDGEGRIEYCPFCRNDYQIGENVCQECGLLLFNPCEDGHRNKSNARFCKVCGKQTEFSNRGILIDYKEVMRKGLSEPPKFIDSPMDRFLDWCAVTGGNLMTADDMQEFGDFMFDFEDAYVSN